MQEPLVAAIDVSKHPVTGLVRIIFESEDGSRQPVYLDQSMCQWLLSAVAENVDRGQLTPISPSLLDREKVLDVFGVVPKPHPDGARVTLLALVDGRQVSIPFTLSFQQLADINAVSRRAAND